MVLSVKTSLDTKRSNPDLAQGKKKSGQPFTGSLAPFRQLLMGARASGQQKVWGKGQAIQRQQIPAGGEGAQVSSSLSCPSCVSGGDPSLGSSSVKWELHTPAWGGA